MEKETGDQHWTYGLTCWKVWAQGFGSGWAGILRYGAMYWTPLIVYAIVYGKDDPSQAHTAAKSKLWTYKVLQRVSTLQQSFFNRPCREIHPVMRD